MINQYTDDITTWCWSISFAVFFIGVYVYIEGSSVAHLLHWYEGTRLNSYGLCDFMINLSCLSITCDIKPEGALHSVFCAGAWKILHIIMGTGSTYHVVNSLSYHFEPKYHNIDYIMFITCKQVLNKNIFKENHEYILLSKYFVTLSTNIIYT